MTNMPGAAGCYVITNMPGAAGCYVIKKLICQVLHYKLTQEGSKLRPLDHVFLPKVHISYCMVYTIVIEML